MDLFQDKSNDVWNLLMKYDLKSDNEINSELKCTICKKLMINACNTPCGCRFCKKCIIAFLNNDQKYCPGYSDECKEELLILNQNINIDQAINHKISKQVFKCPYQTCVFQTDLKKMNDHIRICNNMPLSCPYTNVGCSESELISQNMKSHLISKDFQHATLLSEWIDNMKNEIESLQKKTIALTTNVDELKNEMNSLKLNLTISQREHIASINENQEIIELKNQYDCMKKMFMKTKDKLIRLNTSENYEFRWEIENFCDKQSDAKNGINIEIYSDSVYLAEPGYKICFVFLPNGMKHTGGELIGLGFALMRGIYDFEVSWPFKQAVTLGIVNQANGLVYRQTIIRYEDDDFKDDYGRPKTERNDACGVGNFLDLRTLHDKDALCLNNRIVISCVINRSM